MSNASRLIQYGNREHSELKAGNSTFPVQFQYIRWDKERQKLMQMEEN